MINKVNFSFAFQPIIEVKAKQVFSYEAFIRGINNESSNFILSQINIANMNEFDHYARQKALEIAAKLNIRSFINLNFLPGCLINAHYLEDTIEYFKTVNLSPRQLIIEISEAEIIQSRTSFMQNITKFREMGIKVAIDDFGAGYAGLNLFTNFRPDFIKLDINLIRNIDVYGPRQAIIKAIILVCESLGVDIIALGVETQAEYLWLKKQGIDLFQGYLFAKPGFEQLPTINYPTN